MSKNDPIAWIAAAIFIAMYFGFMLGAAIDKRGFTQPLFEGGLVSVGLLAGVALTVLTLGLVAGYIIYLNRTADSTPAPLASDKSDAR